MSVERAAARRRHGKTALTVGRRLAAPGGGLLGLPGGDRRRDLSRPTATPLRRSPRASTSTLCRAWTGRPPARSPPCSSTWSPRPTPEPIATLSRQRQTRRVADP